jgi:hypothetical protein
MDHTEYTEYTEYIQNGGIGLEIPKLTNLKCPMGLCVKPVKLQPNTDFRNGEDREPRVINIKFLDQLMDDVADSITDNLKKVTRARFSMKARPQTSNNRTKRHHK